MGPNLYSTLDHAKTQLFCRFNSHLDHALLVKIEESNFITNAKNRNLLHTLITETEKIYEGKFKVQYTLPSYHRYIMTTTSDNPLPLEENDRRFVLFRSSDEFMQNAEYWNEMHEYLGREDVKAEFLRYLLFDVDLTEWNATRDRPETEFREEVRVANRPLWTGYLQHEFSEWAERVELEGEENVSPTLILMGKAFKERIEAHVRQTVPAFSMNYSVFDKIMKSIPDNIIRKEEKTAGMRYYIQRSELRGYLEANGWWIDF